MTFKSSSLAKTAKEYAKHFPENVEDYVFSHLNDEMKKAVEIFQDQSYDFLTVALIPVMSELELKKLGEYLVEKLLIHKYQDNYYFEVPEKIHYEGAIFDC